MQQTIQNSNFSLSTLNRKELIFHIYSWKFNDSWAECEICYKKANEVFALDIPNTKEIQIYICKNCFLGNQSERNYKILKSISDFIKELKQNFNINELDEKLLNLLRNFINSLKELIK